MTAPSPFRLGVDLGTSTTIAMLQWPDGRIRPLLFDGSPLLSSAVLLGLDGRLHTGRDANHLARGNPERLEPNPKRRVDDDTVLLGEIELPVRQLLATVLGRVATEAGRVAGQPGEVVLTHPADWGSRRTNLLIEAAAQAGLPRPRLIVEPQAAANYFAHTMRSSLTPDARILIYDLGAGTCDITLLRGQSGNFEVIASDGLNDVGGLDIDAAIVGFLEATYGPLWDDAIGRRQVWEEVRNAKEMLSRASDTVITIPKLGKEVPLGREQFEGLARPVLRPTIAMTKSLLRDAAGGVPGGTALFLVGGSSRIPIVATLLHNELGIAPNVTEQPELVVSEGSLYGPAEPGPAVLDAPAPASGQFAAGGPASTPPGSPVTLAGYSGPVSGLPMPVSASPVSAVSGAPAGYAPTSGAFSASSVFPASGVPASGAFPASGPPVAGYAAAGYPAAPAGYGQPSAAYGQPPAGYGQPPPARRSNLTPMLLGAAIVLVLLVGGIGGYVLLGGKGKPSATANRTPAGQSTGGAGQSTGKAGGGGSGPGPTGGGSGDAVGTGKYGISQLPLELCPKIDLGPFKTNFEQEVSAPQSTRNLAPSAGQTTCSISRQHGNVAGASLTYTATVYADVSVAVTVMKSVLATAVANDPAAANLPGLGDEAVIHRGSGTNPSTANYQLDARDSNLTWTVYVTVSRYRGTFTDSERAQIATDLLTTVKASNGKFTSG